MKAISLVIIVALLSIQVSGQVNKKTIKYRDSTYFSVRHDTIFGTIQYNVYPGIVKGDGMIVHFEAIKWITRLPRMEKVDSTSALIGGAFGELVSKWNVAYIKTQRGYKEVELKFVFNPNR